MSSTVIIDAVNHISSFLVGEYGKKDLEQIETEISAISGALLSYNVEKKYSYEDLQHVLSTLNERTSSRRKRGVYYTPKDVVDYIIVNSERLQDSPTTFELLDSSQPVSSLNSLFLNKTVFDPTCGTGEFLCAALELKLDLLIGKEAPAVNEVENAVSTLFGNDIDNNSIILTKLRILLIVLSRFGVSYIRGLSRIMVDNFWNVDFINCSNQIRRKFDIIVGNPPYVEDSKTPKKPLEPYGNIYANVLANSKHLLSTKGVMGYIIPISYVSTPRMKKIRDEISAAFGPQYILSFSDRPDCLFAGVHQKLCILICSKKGERAVFTSTYNYWYKEERATLFKQIQTIKNPFCDNGFIPKLGTGTDIGIYRKISGNGTPLNELLVKGAVPLYLNMRAAFWIKVFNLPVPSGEYKCFNIESEDMADLLYCVLNSSLFWWYWIAVSDCWHITNKELTNFCIPSIKNSGEAKVLASSLQKKLEKTKVFVGTKQIDYEYKHRLCLSEIEKIDDFVNALYGLTVNESNYIKQFALRYRISGGAGN